MVSALLWRDPEKAASWATQVTDTTRRQQIIRAVASTWARSNKTAAEQWVGSLGLNDEQRQNALRPMGQGDYEFWSEE
jgi:hypothetical protein